MVQEQRSALRDTAGKAMVIVGMFLNGGKNMPTVLLAVQGDGLAMAEARAKDGGVAVAVGGALA